MKKQLPSPSGAITESVGVINKLVRIILSRSHNLLAERKTGIEARLSKGLKKKCTFCYLRERRNTVRVCGLKALLLLKVNK